MRKRGLSSGGKRPQQLNSFYQVNLTWAKSEPHFPHWERYRQVAWNTVGKGWHLVGIYCHDINSLSLNFTLCRLWKQQTSTALSMTYFILFFRKNSLWTPAVVSRSFLGACESAAGAATALETSRSLLRQNICCMLPSVAARGLGMKRCFFFLLLFVGVLEVVRPLPGAAAQ